MSALHCHLRFERTGGCRPSRVNGRCNREFANSPRFLQWVMPRPHTPMVSMRSLRRYRYHAMSSSRVHSGYFSYGQGFKDSGSQLSTRSTMELDYQDNQAPPIEGGINRQTAEGGTAMEHHIILNHSIVQDQGHIEEKVIWKAWFTIILFLYINKLKIKSFLKIEVILFYLF